MSITDEQLDSYRRLGYGAIRPIATELLAARKELAKLEADRERLRAAALRIVEDKYLAWGYAGGLNDCAHGYGEGIPCRKCDEATIRAARKKETL